ncbi:MAG: nucleotidyl transferase AbiEii/AbiGii toxin family protein [Planctomycetota bacterium]|jgi:predicted nucleotidyltransferase component of viral defense system
MISRDEIESKSEEFGIHTAHVERDYVFGWLLVGMYSISELKGVLVLKGGNCFRKAYFPNTRFSSDLDFSTKAAIDKGMLLQELNKICQFVQSGSGVVFEKERNHVEQKLAIDRQRKVYQAKLYFKDFYGNPEHITISVRLDVTEFDRIYLPVQSRFLVHPYSDENDCKVQIRCVKLEELLATKLKCLLQRRRCYDLYDYVYSIFINREIDVKRSEIVTTFLKKTIFEPSPGVVRGLLLELPFEVFRGIWHKYIVCPMQSVIKYELALTNFKQNIEELFGKFGAGYGRLAFFPAKLRNPIIDAGSTTTLLEVVYDGIKRQVEPYSLVYKRRRDGYGQEYFYVYDRTGGRSSGPGIKCFVNNKVGSITATSEGFEPRYPVELSKAGEFGDKTYFGTPFGESVRTSSPFRGKKARRSTSSKGGLTYTIECSYCGKKFRRSAYTTKLNKHKDRYGNPCSGRIGFLVS